MLHRPLCWLAAVAALVIALAPRSVTHADKRIYLPFAVASTCNFASPAHGPTPGPLPTLAARRWEHLRPANTVQGLALDERTGDLWSVGSDGIAKWSHDGVLVSTFTVADGLPGETGNTADWGIDVAVAPNGTVWAIVHGTLTRQRPDGRWAAIEVPTRARLLVVDRSGAVWVGGQGVARLGPECGWESPVRGYPFEPKADVTAMLSTANGDVWVATKSPGGAPNSLAVRRADGTWRVFGATDGLRSANGPVEDLAESPDGQVWCLSGERDASRDVPVIDVLGQDGRWHVAPVGDLSLFTQDRGLHSVSWGPAGRPWFRGDYGIYVPDDANPARWRVELPTRTDIPWARSWPTLHALTIGVDGAAWVGSGVMQRRLSDGTWPRAQQVGPYSPDAVAIDGESAWLDTHRRKAGQTWSWHGAGFPTSAYKTNDIALAPDGVWYATNAGLVHRAADGGWTLVATPDALGGRDVSDVVAATDGSVWAAAIGSSAEAFVTRHRPDGRWEAHSTATGLPSGTVRGVAAGGNGAVWVGIVDEDRSKRHIASLQPDGSWTDLALPVAIQTGGIQQMVGDASGALWLFSTDDGLLRRAADGTWDTFAGQPAVDLSTGDAFHPSSEPVLAIGPDGSAWIGGRSGEVRVRRPDGAWRSLMLLDFSRVQDIAIGPDGRAWMTMVDGGSPRVVEVEP